MSTSKLVDIQDPYQINHTCADQEIQVSQFADFHHYNMFI